MVYSNNWSSLYLGNISEMDTNEATVQIEDSSEILGTFGSTSDPLHNNVTNFVTDSYSTPNVHSDNTSYYTTMTYDVGSGTVVSEVDTIMLMAGTVTFDDGSQLAFDLQNLTHGSQIPEGLQIIQDTEGNLFLVIHDDQSELAAKAITSVEFTSVTYNYFTGLNPNNYNDLEFVCYAPGTMIETPDGPRAVESLRPGDMVTTLDNGPQEIRWVRHDEQPLEESEADDKPVLIAAGALGPDLPAQDLIVSPQHRILVGGHEQLQNFFDQEVFVPAKSLTKLPKIRYMSGKKSITWIHFACGAHEVVLANGCMSESLLIGPMVIKGLSVSERLSLSKIYNQPLVTDAPLNGPLGRECLKVGQARRLIDKKLKSNKKLRLEEEITKWDRDLEMEKFEAELLSDQDIPLKTADTGWVKETKRAAG